MSVSIMERLSEITFSVYHSPNCASPYQVRLVGRGASRLDNIHPSGASKDICGYGATLEEAAEDAWNQANVAL